MLVPVAEQLVVDRLLWARQCLEMGNIELALWHLDRGLEFLRSIVQNGDSRDGTADV